MTSTAFARKFSDRQRAALVYAVLDSGQKISAKQSAHLAGRGELPAPYHDLDPFICTARYVQELVGRERIKREGQGSTALGQAPPKDSARKVLATCFDMLDGELRWLKRQKHGTRAEAIQRVLRTTKDAIELEAKLQQPSATKTAEKPKPQKQKPTPAAEMADRIRQRTADRESRTDSESAEDQPSVSVGHGNGDRQEAAET